MLTIEDIRAQFPFLASGHIYLNHAATSPWSRSVEARVEQFKAGRMLGDIDIYTETMRVITEARAMAASMLGTDAENIAFVQNTSEGLNILASGLQWSAGDRVLLVDHEFPANVYPFLNLKRLGVEVDFIPQKNGVVAVEDIANAITPRTKLVAVSWVQFLSGFTIDLNSLLAVCHSKGVLLSVDAIQGIGARWIDLSRTPVDFLSAGTQKWQMGPQGLAIVYIPKETRERISQAHLGWISVKNAWDFFDYNLDLLDDARRYENGTFNAIGIHAYHGALSLFREVGFDRVEAFVKANTTHAYQRAVDVGFEVITPANETSRAGIVTFRHEQADRMQQELQRRKITVSARAGHVRIAPHFYNTIEEIDTTFAAIMEFGTP